MAICTSLNIPAQTTTSDFARLSAQANAARDADHVTEAAALYQKALKLRPGWTEGWWSLGTLQYDQNQYAAAAQAFHKLVTLNSTNGTAYAMLGLCEFELGEEDAALRHLQRSKSLGITNGRQLGKVVIYHEGVLLQRRGKFQAAQEDMAELCREDIQDNKLLVALGMASLRMRAQEVPADESEVIPQVGRAACLAAQKKFDEARQLYEALLQTHSGIAGIHYAYGESLLDANDTQSAVDQFKLEIANNPADITSRLKIAAAEYKVNSAAGLPYASEAVKLNPQIPFAHYLLGLLLLDTDDFQKAIPELEIATRSFPSEAKLYFALSSAYARDGRKLQAEKARAKFVQLNGSQANSLGDDTSTMIHRKIE